MNVPLPETPWWWQWPTILSLDAPLVAIAWQLLFARLAHAWIGWPEVAVLGLSVWLAYVADRWFEGWRVAPDAMRTQRHRFYQRHRWTVAAAWAVAFVADIAISFARLSGRELVAGVCLLVPALAYVLSHQLIHRENRWRAPKELCIASLLAGGACVFIAAQPGVIVHLLILPTFLFGALCFANVALIAVWEQEVDEIHGQTSLARQFRGAVRASRVLPWLLLIASLACVSPVVGAPNALVLCTASSSALLGLLDLSESKLGWQLARVLADFALLTPFAVLAFAQLQP